MSRQQDNEKPSLSMGWFWGPQYPARKSNFESSPMSRQQNNEKPSLSYSNAPTISDSTNSQCNAIQADSANNSNFNQNLTAGQVTRSNAAQQPVRPGNVQSSPMSRQQNNKKPSLSYSNAPTISNSTNSQCNAIQVASANNSNFNQDLTAGFSHTIERTQHPAGQGNFESSPMTEYGLSDSRSPEAQTQPANRLNG